MFYSTFGYAQLTALINISCTPTVAADGRRERVRGGELGSQVEEGGEGGLEDGWMDGWMGESSSFRKGGANL